MTMICEDIEKTQENISDKTRENIDKTRENVIDSIQEKNIDKGRDSTPTRLGNRMELGYLRHKTRSVWKVFSW